MTTRNAPIVPGQPQQPRNTSAGAGTLMAPISSATLLQGQPSVLIEHQGSIYALRATRAGKLILTK